MADLVERILAQPRHPSAMIACEECACAFEPRAGGHRFCPGCGRTTLHRLSDEEAGRYLLGLTGRPEMTRVLMMGSGELVAFMDERGMAGDERAAFLASLDVLRLAQRAVLEEAANA